MDPLRSLLEELGLPPAPDARIHGRDPVLPTRFRIGEAAAAAIATCGAAAAAIHQQRGGPPQSVRVDVARAAAALLSFAFQRLEGGRELRRPALDNPTVALYPTADDRWIHLHGGFPHLERGTLDLLRAPRDRDTVARRVREWKALELEDALAERGLCGAVVRSADEWHAHPQGRSVGAEPLVAVERVGDAPAPDWRRTDRPHGGQRADGPAARRPHADRSRLARPTGTPAAYRPPGDRPLSGVRVLDLTRVLAGPTVGRTLAEHGADVLKLTAPHLPSIEPFVVDTGHGKRSAHLDLRDPANVRRLHDLVREADVVVDGYRPGALAKRGLSEEELRAANPALVHVQISCYGHTGPWHTRRGWEQLAQTASGIAHEQGAPGPPALLPAAATDYTTGYLAAAGTMAALHRRAEEGGAWRVRASLTRTAMWLLALERAEGEPTGLDPERVAQWQTATDTEWGRLVHLAPVVEMERIPTRWDASAAPLGTHPASWT